MVEPPVYPSGADPTGENLDDASTEALSLEALGAAYAQLIEGAPAARSAEPRSAEPLPHGPLTEDGVPPEQGNVTPQSILEAMLFVGNPSNEPLTSQQVVALLRGVSTAEVGEMVTALNRAYEAEKRPYRIDSVGAGYVLRLEPKYESLRDKFYGRVRQARLSQAAIDVLAIVAYQQPLPREEIERLRGRPSGGVLNQLVGRGLLRIDRPPEAPRQPHYLTTERFLQLFGMESLSELPESHDLERDF